MPDYDIRLKVGNDEAVREIQQVSQELDRAIEKARTLASALQSGNGTDAMRSELSSTLGTITSARGAISALQNNNVGRAAPSPALSAINLGGAGAGWNASRYFPSGLNAPAVQIGMPAAMPAAAGGGAGGGVPPGVAGLIGTPPGAPPPGMPPGVIQYAYPAGPGGGLPPGGLPPPWVAPASGGFGMNMGLARGLMYAAGNATAGGFNLATQASLSGGVMPSSMSGIFGNLIGGIGGALLGSMFGPWGGMIGASVGSNVGGAAFSYFTTPMDLQVQTGRVLTPLINGVGAGLARHTWQGYDFRIQDIHNNWQGTNFFNPDWATDPQIGQTFTGLSEAMLAGGTNPFRPYGSRVLGFGPYNDINDVLNRTMNGRIDPTTAPFGGAYAALDVMARGGIGRENYAEAITRRLYSQYGSHDAVQQVLKNVLPIYADAPNTAGNVADILGKFGPLATRQYLSLGNDDGSSSVSMEQLLAVSGGTASLRRSQRLAATRARGVAGTEAGLFGAEMGMYASLPGGTDSVAYGEANARRREATLQHFAEIDAAGFGVSMAHLQGARQRADILPFNPSNIMGLDIGMARLASQQANTLSRRMASLRGRGDLSEEQELRMIQQIEQLRTAAASGIAELAEGWENRLPALSAGRPAFFGRFSSMQLAAAELGRTGSPIRAYGARNGAQVGIQNNFLASMGASPADVGPYSRTSGMNNDGAVLSRLDRIANSLDRIASGGGGRGAFGPRPSDLAGQVAGMLGTKRDPRDDMRGLFN